MRVQQDGHILISLLVPIWIYFLGYSNAFHESSSDPTYNAYSVALAVTTTISGRPMIVIVWMTEIFTPLPTQESSKSTFITTTSTEAWSSAKSTTFSTESSTTSSTPELTSLSPSEPTMGSLDQPIQTDPSHPPPPKPKLSIGAVFGGVLGGIIGLIAIGYIVYWLVIRNRRSRSTDTLGKVESSPSGSTVPTSDDLPPWVETGAFAHNPSNDPVPIRRYEHSYLDEEHSRSAVARWGASMVSKDRFSIWGWSKDSR